MAFGTRLPDPKPGHEGDSFRRFRDPSNVMRDRSLPEDCASSGCMPSGFLLGSMDAQSDHRNVPRLRHSWPGVQCEGRCMDGSSIL